MYSQTLIVTYWEQKAIVEAEVVSAGQNPAWRPDQIQDYEVVFACHCGPPALTIGGYYPLQRVLKRSKKKLSQPTDCGIGQRQIMDSGLAEEVGWMANRKRALLS